MSISLSSHLPSLDIYVFPVVHLVPAVPQRENATIVTKDFSIGLGAFSPFLPPTPLRTNYLGQETRPILFFISSTGGMT